MKTCGEKTPCMNCVPLVGTNDYYTITTELHYINFFFSLSTGILHRIKTVQFTTIQSLQQIGQSQNLRNMGQIVLQRADKHTHTSVHTVFLL